MSNENINGSAKNLCVIMQSKFFGLHLNFLLTVKFSITSAISDNFSVCGGNFNCLMYNRQDKFLKSHNVKYLNRNYFLH
mgnify:CR=1 FL=1